MELRHLLVAVACVEHPDEGFGEFWTGSKCFSTGSVLAVESAGHDKFTDGLLSMFAGLIVVSVEDFSNSWDDWGASFEGSLAVLNDLSSNSEDAGDTILSEGSVETSHDFILKVEGIEAWLIKVSEGGVEVWADESADIVFTEVFEGSLEEWDEVEDIVEEEGDVSGTDIFLDESNRDEQVGGEVISFEEDRVQWSFLELNCLCLLLLFEETAEESAVCD